MKKENLTDLNNYHEPITISASSEIQFREAFLKAQQQFEPAEKSGENPHFRSYYSTLTDVWNACKKALHENGFMVHQIFSVDGASQVLSTKLCHQGGWFEISSCLLPAHLEPQKMGSAISYYRRYSLAAILSLTQADDDAHEATTSAPSPVRAAQNSNEYRVGIPKSKDYGKTLEEIGFNGVRNSYNYWTDRIKKEGKPASGEVKKFIDIAKVYLETDFNSANDNLSDPFL